MKKIIKESFNTMERLKQKLFTKIMTALLLIVIIIFCFSGQADKGLNRVLGKWDTVTSEHLTELSVKAGASYAITRGLNGIISVIQGSELTPVFATIAVGEIIDPLNDIVEKVSTVMLVSLISVGIQKLLHQVSMGFSARWLLSFCFLFFLLKLYYPGLIKKLTHKTPFRSAELQSSLASLFLAAFILIRFLIPAVAFISINTEDIVMSKYQDSLTHLEEIHKSAQNQYRDIHDDIKSDTEPTEQKTSEEITLFPLQTEPKKEGLFSSLKNKILNGSDLLIEKATEATEAFKKTVIRTKSSFDLKKKVDDLMTKLNGMITYFIDLVIIFLFQTVVLPLVTLWLLKNLTRTVMQVLLRKDQLIPGKI